MAIATAVIEVSKQIYNLAKKSMDYADTVGDMAAKFGVATEAISEMQYIASQTGSDIGTLTSSMSMLYMRAKQDGEAFQELGVSVKDSQGNFKAMDELFWETVGAMNSLESEGEKSAYMLDLFGRSASSIGELLRKDTDEINAMRQEAHDLGVVMNEETINYASDFNDTLAVLKLQGQSALASLVAGAPDAEQKLSEFIDRIMVMLESYVPEFIEFGVRFLIRLSISLNKYMPKLAWELVGSLLDVLLDFEMWFQVGVDIGKVFVEGMLNVVPRALNALFGWAGVDIPELDLGVGDNVFEPKSATGGEYEISERIDQKIEVSVEAKGDTTVSQETAEKTAEALAPYIDKWLGGR